VKGSDDSALAAIDLDELDPQLDAAFAPFAARQEWAARGDGSDGGESLRGREKLVFKGDEPLQESIRTAVRLAERIATAASTSYRIEWEAASYRSLCRSRLESGAGAAGVVADAVDAAAVSLISIPDGEEPVLDRIYGKSEEPLLSSEWGRCTVREMSSAGEPRIVADLHRECEDREGRRALLGIKGVAAVPVASNPARLMLVYSQLPDGAFEEAELRFLMAAAGIIGAGLRHAGLSKELREQDDRASRIRDGLRDMEASHHGFLRGISQHSLEMLAAIRDAAVLLRDRRSQGRRRSEALATIVDSAEILRDRQEELIGTSERLQEQVGRLLRLMEAQSEEQDEEVCNAG
jgi:GAF domain-containing protein